MAVNRIVTPAILLWCVGVWIVSAPSGVQATRIEDLNTTQRIILTLANSLSPEYQSSPDDMPELMQMVDDGIIHVDEEEGAAGEGKGVYAYSFRLKLADFAASGYFRIASPARYAKPETEKGWRQLAEDTETGAKVWFRSLRTPGVEYNEIEASLAKGSFVFAVSHRRPPEEPEADARRAILERFHSLLANAKRYGLLSTIVIEVLTDAEESQGKRLEENGLINVLGHENQATTVKLRILAEDHEGERPGNVDFYTIEVKGFLAKHVTIQGAAFNEEKNRYEVHDPPSQGALITVTFPALNNRNFARDIEENTGMESDFGITLEADAVFSPRKQQAPA